MPLNSFQTASERLRLAVNTVYMLTRVGMLDDAEAERDLRLLAQTYQQHWPLIEARLAELRAVSDGPISWPPGRGLSGIGRGWSSAHEAAGELCDLVLQYSGEARYAFHMSLEEVADIQERILRERAKVLTATASDDQVEGAAQ